MLCCSYLVRIPQTLGMLGLGQQQIEALKGQANAGWSEGILDAQGQSLHFQPTPH